MSPSSVSVRRSPLHFMSPQCCVAETNMTDLALCSMLDGSLATLTPLISYTTYTMRSLFPHC